MKIAQLVCTFPPYRGGIGTSAEMIAKMLASCGHEVTTFTPEYQEIKNFTPDTENAKTIYLKPWLKYGNGAFLPQLLFYLKNYDIIYLHYPFFGGAEVVWFYKLFASRTRTTNAGHSNCKKTKLVIHYHHDVVSSGFIPRTLSIPANLTRNSLFKKADKIISASLDYVANSIISKFYENYKNKFIEIPFAVDIHRFKPLADKQNAITKILFVGGLDQAHYFKGLEILLQALAQVKNNNWELNIAGSGDLKPQYKKIAKDLNIIKQVNFLGRISDVDLPLIYRQADFFVLPSINKGEAFGLVLLEAMASGLPIIATNLPGVRSVFENSKEGLLAEPNNIYDLREGLEKLLNDKNLRNQMGVNARKLVEEKYSQDVIMKMLKNYFIN